MTDITKHFKEREPLETVNIIENFFNKKGYYLFKDQINQSECGTYSNRIELYINDIYMSCANGKGMTRDYCLASCYGELYERFCDVCEIIKTNLAIKSNFYNEEYQISNTDNQLKIESLNLYYLSLLKNKENIDYLFHNLYEKIVDTKFINIINNKDNIYFDYRIMNRAIGSMGLATGNTFYEAFNQGLSELLEKNIAFNFFSNPQDKYYIISKKYINNQQVLEKLNIIESLGYDIYLVDLSYNFNVPVCMSLLVNKKENNFVINFGAFADIDIALERIITELYQGVSSYHKTHKEFLEPFKNKLIELQLRDNCTSFSRLKSFPEDFFNKLIYGDYNHNIFLEKSSSNEEIFQQLIKICNNLNYKIYYKDISLIKDMYCLRIFIPNFCIHKYECNIYKNISDERIQFSLNYINKINILKNSIDKNQNYSQIIKNLKEALILYNNNLFDKDYIHNLVFDDIMNPIGIHPDGQLIRIINEIFQNPTELDFEMGDYIKTIFYNNIKFYKSLQYYIKSNKYTKQEIINIFKIFNRNVSEEDFKNIFNSEYLFKKIYLDKAIEVSNIEKYENIIKDCIKEKIKNEISS